MCVIKQLNLNLKINILNNPTHKEFDKGKHIKLTIKNPDINEIDNTI